MFGGDARPFVAAIIAIDAATVGNWAERRNLAYANDALWVGSFLEGLECAYLLGSLVSR